MRYVRGTHDGCQTMIVVVKIDLIVQCVLLNAILMVAEQCACAPKPTAVIETPKGRSNIEEFRFSKNTINA